MTATDRTPPPLKWLCLGNRDANDGFELFAHGIYARNGALVGSKLSLRERRQRVDLSAFLSGAPPLLAEAAVKHLLARLLCVHRHNTDLELLGKNFIPLHASSLCNAGVCERLLASARQLQQHQVELCLLLAIDEQEPASAEYLASLARLRDSGVRIALHPQRIDTDARQCFAEVDAGLCDYLGLDARLLAPGPLTRNLRQRKSIEYLLPHSLSVRAAYLDQHPEVGCVGALVIYIDSEGQETKRQNGNRIRQLDFDYLLGNAYVCGAPVSLYRMEALRAAGFYDPEIKVQDFQMTLRIASQGYQIHKLPVLVTRYRRHPDNLSRRYKVLLDADLRTIAPYQSHPAYERGRTELVNKALKYAVVADKRHAWQLLRSLPLRQWNRTTFRRLKRFLLHHES